jgi:hypothetical protein
MLVDEDDHSGGLEYWKPDSPLPVYNRMNHLAPPAKRMAQRIAHSILLPVLDQMRPRYPEDYQPERMPEEVPINENSVYPQEITQEGNLRRFS